MHFKSLYEFCKRIDAKRVGKKVIEDLVDAGCFDFTGWSRDALRQSVDPMFETALRDNKEQAAGIMSLFALMGETSEARFHTPPTVKIGRTKLQLLLREKELVGFFLTGHPLDTYKEILSRLSCVPFSQIESMPSDVVFRAAFIVETVQTRISSKTQKKFAILTISDGMERYELPVWSELFEEKGHLLRDNQLLYAVLQVEKKEDELKLSCKWLDDLSLADEAMIAACDLAYDKAKFQAKQRSQYAKTDKTKDKQEKPMKQNPPKNEGPMKIHIDADRITLRNILMLKQLFEKHRGAQPLQVDFTGTGAHIASLHIGSAWGIEPTPQFESDLALFNAQLAGAKSSS